MEGLILSINNLWDKTVPELRAMAKKHNITGYSKMTKTPLIKELSSYYGFKKNAIKTPGTPFEEDNFDQYFTRTKTANKCLAVLESFMKNKKIKGVKTWIEPSVGSGVFYNQFPKNIKKIGIDLDKTVKPDLNINFYEYKVPKKAVVVGNPPFGYRGEDALRFINHSKNADVVAFILPMFFSSKGKGSAQFRVTEDLVLAKQIELAPDSFETPDGKRPKVYTVFQIWVNKRLGIKSITPNINWYNPNLWSDDIEMKTICTNKNRICGIKEIGNCDLYISSSFYGEITFVKHFNDVKYGAGIGLKIKNKKIIEKILKIDISKYANRSTSGVFHLGISSLKLMFIEEGIVKFKTK